MSYRGGGYRGGRGGRGDDGGGFRGRGGGFKSKMNSNFDRRPFTRGDRFGKPDRGDFRKSYQDDFRGDGGFRSLSPKRFRGESSSYGADRSRSFKDFSRGSDSLERSGSDYPGRKSRGGRGSRFRGSAGPPSRGSRGGLRRGSSSSFSTRSGFITKRRDFTKKFSGSSSRRDYVGRLKPIRSRSRRDDDCDSDEKHKSDDEIRDEEDDEDDDEEELEEEEVEVEEEEMEEEEGNIEEGDLDEENDNIDEELLEHHGNDRDLEPTDELGEDKEQREGSPASLQDENSRTPEKKVLSKKRSLGSDGEKRESEQDSKLEKSVSDDKDAVTSDDKPHSDKVTTKKIVKKIVKVTKKTTSVSKSEKDKDKEKEKDRSKKESKFDCKDEYSSDAEGIVLSCPHCSFSNSHVRVYDAHLKSKSHLLVMNQMLARSRKRVLTIRQAQRKKQIHLDREARGLKLATFNCTICKLNYRTLKTDHVNSTAHRMLKRIMMPECRICNVRFKTSVMYDAHVCDIRHLRKKAKLEAELGKEISLQESDLDVEEEDELDPSSFMVLDAAESDDDEADEDGEKSKEKKSKPRHRLGAEMCKKVEIYYCELCDIHLTRLSHDREEALTLHCSNPKHLEKYYRYQQKLKRKEEQQAREKRESERKKAEENGQKTEKESEVQDEPQEDKEDLEEEDEVELNEDEEEMPLEEDEQLEEEGVMDEEEEELEDDKLNEANSDLADLLGEAEEELAAENDKKDNGTDKTVEIDDNSQEQETNSSSPTAVKAKSKAK